MFLCALGVLCFYTYPYLRTNADPLKMVITEDIEQINTFPCLALIDSRLIIILSNFGFLDVSSFAATAALTQDVRY